MQRTAVAHSIDLSSPSVAERFRRAAAALTKRATKSKKTATRALVAEGIYTKKGKLSKHYR